MGYTYDLLEPSDDLDKSLDVLSKNLSKLYYESWEADKRANYDRAFNLNINAFAQMWFNRHLKIFMAYDEYNEPIGFLIGMTFRPLPYEANVFQVEDWFTRHNMQVEQELFKFVEQAIRFIGCDEIWCADKAGRMPPFSNWKEANVFQLRRYLKR